MTLHEKALLGQIMLDEAVIHDCGLLPRHFSSRDGREIYQAMLAVVEAGHPPDEISVAKHAPEHQRTIDALRATVPSAANWSYYRDAVRQEYRKRRLGELAAVVKDCAHEPDTALSKIESHLLEIYADANDREVRKTNEYLVSIVTDMERRYHRRGELPGISSGISGIDTITMGWQPGQLVYVGARPSMGKSALLANFASHACARQIPVGFVSIESSGKELMTRVLCSEANIDTRAAAAGRIGTASQFAKLTDAAERIEGWPMWVYDNPDATLDDVVRRARQLVTYHGARMLCIDYLQLIAPATRAVEWRQHIAECSIAMKGIARRFSVPVIVAVQMRRDAEGRTPTLADFSETSQIEKDADIAILIHRRKEAWWLSVAKNRDGEKGDVPVTFLGPTVRFVERTLREA